MGAKSTLPLIAVLSAVAIAGLLSIGVQNSVLSIPPFVQELEERLTATETNLGEVIPKLELISELQDDFTLHLGEVIPKLELISELQDDLDDLNTELNIVKNSKIDVTKIYQKSQLFTVSKLLSAVTLLVTCNSPTDIILNAGVGTSLGFVIEGSDPVSSSSWEFSLKNKIVEPGDTILTGKATCLETT